MQLLKLHSEPIQAAWLDDYGHLNEAYYLVPFSNATWKLQEHFAIGLPYFKQTGCALYTVETHLRYLHEVRAPAVVEIESMLLGAAPKKIWFAHQMRVADKICATAEFVVLHYDTTISKTTALPDTVQQHLQAKTIATHPEWLGRRVGL